MRTFLRRPALALALLASATLPSASDGAGSSPAAPEKAPAPRGLYVRDGVLMRGGRPYRGIGANYFSLFSRLLADPSDSSSLAGLADLASARIPFVRFMACGFWPADMKLYLADREEYFRRLDRVVRCAEEKGIGLIPSLFWYFPTVPDLAGEPMDALGDPASKSVAFIRRYTEEVVRRYRDSPAIWGWELGNEYNLDVDLPNHPQHRPPVVPSLGTPAIRSERDEMKFAHLRTVLVAFAGAVRGIDEDRIILSGNSIPRTSAWHNFREKSWTRDSEAQFAEILLRDDPDPLDTITVHIYKDEKGVYAGGAGSVDEAVGVSQRYAAKARKPLFLGEFGASRALGPPDVQKAVLAEFLAAIAKHDVPLAAFWVFDHGAQKENDITFRNDRSFLLDLVIEANARRAETR